MTSIIYICDLLLKGLVKSTKMLQMFASLTWDKNTLEDILPKGLRILNFLGSNKKLQRRIILISVGLHKIAFSWD